MENAKKKSLKGSFVCADKYLAAALVTRGLTMPKTNWAINGSLNKFVFSDTPPELEQFVIDYLADELEVSVITFVENLKEIEDLGSLI